MANDWLENIPPFYRDILIAYNKSKAVNQKYFIDNILEQPIWGNYHIKVKLPHQKVCSRFYPNWVNEGLVKISNLKFVNGILDEYFIYQKVKIKTNV